MRELDERTRTDREYRAKVEALDAELAKRSERVREAERPLLTDLGALGLDVESVWDLRARQPYPDGTFDVLLRHLATTLPDRTREGIARALAVADARDLWPVLVDAYRNETSPEDSGAREGLAEALMITAHRAVADDLVELIRDRSLGISRVLLLRAVTRLRLPDRWDLIAACAQDPALHREAEHMLAERARRQQCRQT